MHAKPDLRVFLKWMIAGSGSVITDVMSLPVIRKIIVVGIDELNTISLEVLQRFGDQKEAIDLWLFLLACSHIVAECRDSDFPVALDFVTLVLDLVANDLADDERLRLLRNAKITPKALDDCRANGSFCEQTSELLHFALYQETSEFLASQPTQIDLIFVRELISLAILDKYDRNEGLICHSDFADAVLLADAYVQWSTALESRQANINTAMIAIGKLTNMVKTNRLHHERFSIREYFP